MLSTSSQIKNAVLYLTWNTHKVFALALFNLHGNHVWKTAWKISTCSMPIQLMVIQAYFVRIREPSAVMLRGEGDFLSED